MDQLEKICPYSTPPKLVFNSFQSYHSSRRAESPAGMATPPIRLPGAVPFRWEEAPGRPKQKPSQSDAGAASADADADRQLGLPPRLSASASLSIIRDDSRDVVLDRSCFLMRRPSFLFSGRRRRTIKYWDVGSERSASEDTPNSSASSDFLRSFSSVSACSFFSNGEEEVESKEDITDVGKGKERKVRILRFKRKRSLACVASYTASQFWASIFGRLKQTVIVPCQRDPKI